MSSITSFQLRERGRSRGGLRIHAESFDGARGILLKMRGGVSPTIFFNLENGTISFHSMPNTLNQRRVVNRFLDLASLPYEVKKTRTLGVIIRNKENDSWRLLAENFSFGLSGRQYRFLVDKCCVSDGEVLWAVGRRQHRF